MDAPRRRQVKTSFRRGQKRSKKGLLWALTLTICRRKYRRQNGLEISNFESFKRAAASWGVGECSEEVGGDQACPRTQGERLSEGVGAPRRRQVEISILRSKKRSKKCRLWSR